MNIVNKKIAAVLCAAAMILFSATSCGVLEIRDATSEQNDEIIERENLLEQAERYNEVEKVENTETDAESMGNTGETENENATEEKRIKLTLTGSIAIDSRINEDAAYRANGEKPFSFLTMFAAIYPRIRNTDIAVTTLEAPCADPDIYPVTGANAVNMPIEALTALKDLGFDVINTAGTNLKACGDDGIRSTITNVCNTEVLQIGAYQDTMDANDVRFYEQDGVIISFVSVMEEAPESEMLIPSLAELETVKSNIAYADLISDVVVVCVTWNPTDSGKRQEYAQTLTDSGADIIVGYDDTSLGDAEWMEANDGTKTLVVYSLGNLISTGTDAKSVLGGILDLEIVTAEGSILLENITIIPTVSHHTTDNEYQVVELNSYTDDTAALHSVKGLKVANLKEMASSGIPAEFLASE